MVSRTVLTRSGPISLNTARLVNIVQPRTTMNNAGPMKNVINNAYSTARRPYNKITAANNSNFTRKINIVKGTKVNTAKPKAVLSAIKGNKGNAVKASACWVWRPKHKILDHVSRNNGASMAIHNYEEFDGEFVAFGDFKLTNESHVLLKVPRKRNYQEESLTHKEEMAPMALSDSEESDSDDEDDKPKPKVVKKTVESKTVKQDVVSDGKLKKKTIFPTPAKIEVVKPKQQEKPVRKLVKYAEMYRLQKPRGNQRNWNNLKSQQLGNEFVMNNKACFACGSFNHLIKDCEIKV
ncbi:hypothetical protein Tco_1475442 [Tanacetum coccineum]